MKMKMKHTGLTLVEILVAILIIALLAAGLYSVGNYLETQSKIKLTESTIEILASAVEQYHDFYGKFPDVDDANGMPMDYSSANEIEKLYCKFSFAPDAKKIINQINSSLIKDTDGDKYPEIVDSWDKEFKYEYDKDIKQNFPVITSAGPDKIFGDSDDISSR